MSFGVFSPREVKSEGQARAVRDSIQAHNLAKTIDELLQEKKRTEDDFDASIKALQERHAKEVEGLNAQKSALEAEIQKLEKRRKAALSPLLIDANDIHSTQKELSERTRVLALQEQENEETRRALVRRLDEIAERERQLDDREQSIARMKKGAEMQRSQIESSSKRLNARMEAFERTVADKEMDFAFKESELDARRKLYEDNDKRLIERENELAAGRRLLQDQRLLLEKGFEELRKSQKKHGAETSSAARWESPDSSLDIQEHND